MQFDQLKRREFITLLGGATMAWPLAARAQQSVIPSIGLIQVGSPETNVWRMTAFRQGMSESGYVEGRNVTFEYRWAEGGDERYSELVADLIRAKVSVIVTGANTPASLAAKAATSTITIVFGVSDDPVKLGLVASLARPGGNATGVNFLIAELGTKRFGLLREMVPTAARVAVLVDPGSTALADATVRDAQTAAAVFGMQVRIFNGATIGEIDAAFAGYRARAGRCSLRLRQSFFQQPACATRHSGGAPRNPRDLSESRVRRSRRADELRNQPPRRISSDRRLCRTHPQRRKTSRLAGGAADQFRARH